jgi:hypothetical protein
MDFPPAVRISILDSACTLVSTDDRRRVPYDPGIHLVARYGGSLALPMSQPVSPYSCTVRSWCIRFGRRHTVERKGSVVDCKLQLPSYVDHGVS